MIKRILKSVCIISIFTGGGALFTLHTFTYWSFAIFYLSFSILLLLFPIYWLFNRKKTRRRNDSWGIILSVLLGLFSFCIGKPYILDIPNAISKKYVTLRNAEIIKADFHQGTGRGANLETYYNVLVKEADSKQITLEVYTNFDIIRGKRTLTKYNISYLPHSKEIVSVSLSKKLHIPYAGENSAGENQTSTKSTDDSGTTSSTVQSPHQTASVQKQDYLSELNMILTDYNKVRNEYNQYHTQYSTKVITISGYRDSIGTLMAPLNFDYTQVRYLQNIAPANALDMMQKLIDSINDFNAYIELLVDSLKTSNQTEASQALPYLTKSDQAFQEFNALYQAYISNR
jgi:hypothetical protein